MANEKLNVAAFFAGAGGLDLGFKLSNFGVGWANEYDKSIWATYEHNFPQTKLDRRSIVEVEPEDIPEVTGFIGGPPCQSWSEAGSARGIDDHRGQLFYEYLRLIEAKRPKFFLAENVSGLLFSKHNPAVKEILGNFAKLGYNVSYGLLSANDYGVPQTRDRVIIVGYDSRMGKFFEPPATDDSKPSLRDAIWDLRDSARAAGEDQALRSESGIANHEFMTGGFSSMYMSRNRVRAWDEPSFTIQAMGRHAPLHPQAPRMLKVATDRFAFDSGAGDVYRRLTVRDCARVQTFPDTHLFIYKNVVDGYKMIGNAVPVEFAKRIANEIRRDLSSYPVSVSSQRSPGEIRTFSELANDRVELKLVG
jgi:DNA (cytosine-5)-methyltransferase 1